MSNSITYDAAEHNVHSVTVFQVNSAEVTRRIEVDLKKGQNEINIKNLPTVLDGNSIRVDGIGKAVVFDVIYKSPALSWTRSFQPPNEKRQKESPKIEGLLAQKATLTASQETVSSQLAVLESYAKTLSSEFAKSDVLAEFLKVYGERQIEYRTKKRELGEQLEKVDEDILAEREKEGKAASDNKRGTRIVVVVLAEEEGPAELSLTYNVSGAFWTPVYDLRAEISSASTQDAAQESNAGADPAKKAEDRSKSSKITLDYRASISQCTAEDWSDVNLTLSTASPQLGSTIPKLSGIQLSEVPTYRTKQTARKTTGVDKEVTRGGYGAALGGAPSGAPPAPTQFAGFAFETDSIEPSMPPPAPLAHSKARVTDQGEGFSSAFVIDGLSNIPSDTDDSSESHKVTISVVHLHNVDLEWVTVPKESQSVFLKAKVKNTTEFTFLPGGASIFMNNNFVAKSVIPSVSPFESFSISLGVDSSVRVTYQPQTKKVNTPTGGFITSSRISTTYSQSITIKNTRGVPLSRLVVKDQVPVSTHAQIKVNVVEPALPDLQAGASKNGADARSGAASKEVSVLAPRATGTGSGGGNTVKARWARANEDDDASNVAALGGGEVNTAGLMEWICGVDANSSVDLKLGWEVNVPKGFHWKQN